MPLAYCTQGQLVSRAAARRAITVRSYQPQRLSLTVVSATDLDFLSPQPREPERSGTSVGAQRLPHRNRLRVQSQRHLSSNAYSTESDAAHSRPASFQEFVFAEDAAAALAQQPAASWLRRCQTFVKFTRPHTMFGTFISVTSVSLLSLGSNPITAAASIGFLQALLSALLMNICIVGINQVYDVEIDRINKPYLPLATGELMQPEAAWIVSSTGAASIALGLASASMPLVGTLVGSLTLGIAYSTDLPYLRWKRFPLAAAACILSVRAILVQLGFYMHMQYVLGATSYVVSQPVVFVMAFMLLFSVVIALFKDIPDISGDSQAGLQTFSVQAGVRKVFWTCIGVLEVAYMGAMAVGLGSQVLWSRIMMTLVHALMGGLLFVRAQQTDLDSSKSIYGCYMFIWKLFYAEYLIIPFLR